MLRKGDMELYATPTLTRVLAMGKYELSQVQGSV